MFSKRDIKIEYLIDEQISQLAQRIENLTIDQPEELIEAFTSVNNTGDRRIQIRVQGSYNSNVVEVHHDAASSIEDWLIISVESIHLVANDTVRIQVFQNSGVSIALIGLSGRFGGHRVA